MAGPMGSQHEKVRGTKGPPCPAGWREPTPGRRPRSEPLGTQGAGPQGRLGRHACCRVATGPGLGVSHGNSDLGPEGAGGQDFIKSLPLGPSASPSSWASLWQVVPSVPKPPQMQGPQSRRAQASGQWCQETVRLPWGRSPLAGWQRGTGPGSGLIARREGSRRGGWKAFDLWLLPASSPRLPLTPSPKTLKGLCTLEEGASAAEARSPALGGEGARLVADGTKSERDRLGDTSRHAPRDTAPAVLPPAP